MRDPRIADTSQSNGFESDNDADGSLTTPFTSAVFSNVTFIGPKGRDGFENTPDYINGGSVFPQNGSALGKFQSAMQIRRSSHLACFNSVAVGYPIGIIIDAEKGATQVYAQEGKLKLQNIFLAGMDITGSDANKRYVDDLYDAANKTEIDAKKYPIILVKSNNFATAIRIIIQLKMNIQSWRAKASGCSPPPDKL